MSIEGKGCVFMFGSIEGNGSTSESDIHTLVALSESRGVETRRVIDLHLACYRRDEGSVSV